MFGENMELYEVTEEYVSYLRRFEPKKILSNADHNVYDSLSCPSPDLLIVQL